MDQKQPDCMEGGDEHIQVVIENLISLKELRDDQHSLQQTRGQLERFYRDYKESSNLASQCDAELSKLEGERSRLQERLRQIDVDVAQLTDLKKELEGVCSQCVACAPTDAFKTMEEKVNVERGTMGMERLPECEAFAQLSRQKHRSMPPAKGRKHCVSMPDASKQSAKAGPSYKQCRNCGHVVSRNAIICSSCRAPCSRPGHSTGKK